MNHRDEKFMIRCMYYLSGCDCNSIASRGAFKMLSDLVANPKHATLSSAKSERTRNKIARRIKRHRGYE